MTIGVTPPPTHAMTAVATQSRTIRCPECLAEREQGRTGAMFCGKEHKVAFFNRQTVRGRVLTPLVMAERVTRSGSTRDKAAGIAARQESRRLMDRWTREDREAGRMAMDEYLSQRARLGFFTFSDVR